MAASRQAGSRRQNGGGPTGRANTQIQSQTGKTGIIHFPTNFAITHSPTKLGIAHFPAKFDITLFPTKVDITHYPTNFRIRTFRQNNSGLSIFFDKILSADEKPCTGMKNKTEVTFTDIDCNMQFIASNNLRYSYYDPIKVCCNFLFLDQAKSRDTYLICNISKLVFRRTLNG